MTLSPKIRVHSINSSLLVALCLAFVYHGALLLSGTFKRTYDAYVHIFFADHYARSWFDNWDYRWYTGFTVTSYPPGAQQSVALLSKQVGLLNAFVIVQLLAILLVIIGTYRFSRLWVGEEAAGYAALIAVFASSIAETVHVFGQLPTMYSLGFLLNALPFLSRWLGGGKWRYLFATLITFAATTAGHHVTTLFGSVFFAGPVIVDSLVTALRSPRADELDNRPVKVSRQNLRPLLVRRFRRVLPVTSRAILFGTGLIVVLLGVVLPYWLWSASDPITQISIPHASRDSYIENINAGIVFWLVPWGLCLLVLPYAAYKGLTSRIWPLVASLGLATFLGTGGTTPFPKMILGPAYEILTLDRFTFWATILILPIAGDLVVSIRHRGISSFLRIQFGSAVWRGIQIGLAATFLLVAIVVANFTQFRQFQPDPIDMQPIVNFINKDQHWRWRYLTLGFGDQMAWLSAQTTATTVDGNYHSARRLPELTTTPIERLEGAKYSGVPGIGSLQQFLAVPDKYNLKYVFSNDQFYDPLLFFSGWHRVNRLENGVVVWEREDIPPLPETLPRKEIPSIQRVMWGVIPLTSIAFALTVLIGYSIRSQLLSFFTFLGLTRLPIRLPGKRFTDAVWNRIDRRLARMASVPLSERSPRDSRWQFWSGWWKRLPRPRPPSRRLRWLNAILVVMVLASTGLSGVRVIARPVLSPSETVEAYFDDLDFRRFDAAYDRLNPDSRPSLDAFLLQLSVKGGLLASYAKLDSVVTTVEVEESDYAVIRAETLWVTSLAEYPSVQHIELVSLHGRWYLNQSDPTEISPPDQFVREPTVSYRSQERRTETTGPTDFADIMDRPVLQILSARLVVNDGLYSVVGEVMNIDVDPADLTVTAIVYDVNGTILTAYNAQTAAIHKLLPKEVSPFRVDFEGVAGSTGTTISTGIEFKANQRFPVERSIWEQAASIQVYAKAVVTGRDLYRDVAVQDLAVTTDASGKLLLTGDLHNTGTVEAVIPHILITYYDAAGSVVWVQEIFLPESIRSQRLLALVVPIQDPAAISTLLQTTQLFANTLQQEVAISPGWGELIYLPVESGYAAARVSINYLPGVGI